MGDMKPFKILGNLYFVGTYGASSHMIDTGEGIILIDSGYEETADVIIESMKTLGFDIRDVKYILHSHGHGDHTNGTEKLVGLSGAVTYLAKEDERYIKGFEPDFDYKDGDVIKLGNTEITVLRTPGHTEGTVSFFFDIEENGKIYRAGMFGGAGVRQLRKDYLRSRDLSLINRGSFFKSVERLKKEHVDVFIGNHCWNNNTRENYELMQVSDTNPFVDETGSKWHNFLCKCTVDLVNVINSDVKEKFVNYAHRGASEYMPENTFLSFYTGIYMGANGIETDVQKTKDGVLVLFHDDTIERLTGQSGAVSDYTLEELYTFTFEKNGFTDKIVVFEDFLKHFAFRDITFAIEIKHRGYEKEVVDMMRKYDVCRKSVVTSFIFDSIRIVKEYAPDIYVGFLKDGVNDETIAQLKAIRADEVCPVAGEITADKVERWHYEGFNVRAWGVSSVELMKHIYDLGVDGMTVNFPDKLTEYIISKKEI